MSRPETIKDVKERMIDIGSLDLERIIVEPKLLKHYTAFIEELQKMGGEIEPRYGTTVQFRLVRNQKQKESQLSTEQYTWDDTQKEYRKAVKADPGDPVQEYKKDRVKEWARAEGLPDPFDVFAANDEELQRIREDFGFDD